MELKHLVQRFVYRIEPTPEGGFIARATDPTVPPLEAPTREELQQKIQAKLVAALGETFPGLQLPPTGKHVQVEFHIGRKPGGGYAVHSDEPGTPALNPATHEKIDHYAEELLDFVDKHFPHLSESIAARVNAELEVMANQQTTRMRNAGPDAVAPSNLLPAQPPESNNAPVARGTFNATTIANTPITPEASNFGSIVRFVLTLLILAVIVYFYLHRT
jgi:hypothetical protein